MGTQEEINTEDIKKIVEDIDKINRYMREKSDREVMLENTINEMNVDIAKIKDKMNEQHQPHQMNGNKGYLQAKNLTPKVFGDKPEEWRMWRDDLEDFMDTINPGMKTFLKSIAEEAEIIDNAWKEAKRMDSGDKIINDEVQVWRTLKALTTGEAKKLILSVKAEDGYRAWQKMHHRFEQGLAAKQGAVLAEFTGMISKPGKNPSETKRLITDIEQKMKNVEDTTGKEIDQNHAKSILIGILDPITRQHTAMKHGQDVSFEELKRLVLEFTNNATDNLEKMQLGSFAKGEYGNDENINNELENENEEAWDESLGAFGKGATQCYSCGGFCHMARECSSKGKGKGPYGKSKGKGDFSGKGFTGKGDFGKGFGGKGFRGKSFGGDQKGKGKNGFKGEGNQRKDVGCAEEHITNQTVPTQAREAACDHLKKSPMTGNKE